MLAGIRVVLAHNVRAGGRSRVGTNDDAAVKLDGHDRGLCCQRWVQVGFQILDQSCSRTKGAQDVRQQDTHTEVDLALLEVLDVDKVDVAHIGRCRLCYTVD